MNHAIILASPASPHHHYHLVVQQAAAAAAQTRGQHPRSAPAYWQLFFIRHYTRSA